MSKQADEGAAQDRRAAAAEARKTGTPAAGSRSSAPPETLPVLPGERKWTAKEVTALRAQLQAEVDEIRAEIHGMEGDLADLIRDGQDPGEDQADTGSRTFERELEMSLAAGSREVLAQVERALMHIDDGTYGVCEVCGNPIGKARLQAFPRASLCMVDKQRAERR